VWTLRREHDDVRMRMEVRMCEHEEKDVWIRTGECEDKIKTRGCHNVRI